MFLFLFSFLPFEAPSPWFFSHGPFKHLQLSNASSNALSKWKHLFVYCFFFFFLNPPISPRIFTWEYKAHICHALWPQSQINWLSNGIKKRVEVIEADLYISCFKSVSPWPLLFLSSLSTDAAWSTLSWSINKVFSFFTKTLRFTVCPQGQGQAVLKRRQVPVIIRKITWS